MRRDTPYGIADRIDFAQGKKTSKVRKTLREFGAGTLHSGSKKGPKVTDRRQAIAIALAQQRRRKK